MDTLQIDHPDYPDWYEVLRYLGPTEQCRAIVRLPDGSCLLVANRHHWSQSADWVPSTPENPIEQHLLDEHRLP